MNAYYVFQSAIYCETCAKQIEAGCKTRGSQFWPESMREDSDHYPQGPYSIGFDEFDSPQHCDACGMFLENPLTQDGVDYIRDAIKRNDGNPVVLKQWRDFYKTELESRS
jgi:hypothetical protein